MLLYFTFQLQVWSSVFFCATYIHLARLFELNLFVLALAQRAAASLITV